MNTELANMKKAIDEKREKNEQKKLKLQVSRPHVDRQMSTQQTEVIQLS